MCIFSPLWVSICLANLLLEVNDLEHCVHWCLFAMSNKNGPEQSDQKLFMGGNASPLYLSNYIQKYEENINDIQNMRAGPGSSAQRVGFFNIGPGIGQNTG